MSEIISSPYTYAVIITIAAFLAAYGSTQVNKQTKKIGETAEMTLEELEKASEKINLSLKEAESANLKLKENNQSIVRNLQKTIETKEATIKSKEEVIGLLTGGDSYPSILFKKNKGFYLLVNGEYGIPNLHIQVAYFKDFLNTQIISLASYLNNNIPVDNISLVYSNSFPRTYPRSLHSIELKELNIDLNKEISHGFDFIFTSEYKKWIQRIRLIPVKGKWEVLYALEEVMTHDKDKTKLSNISDIYFKVSKDYPFLRNHDGKTYGNESFYYMLNNDKRRYLNSSRLFNNGIEIKEKNITEHMDIAYFDDK